jgi:hypothetical protein
MQSKTMREPWLFDLAERLGYVTLQSETGFCSKSCTYGCEEKFTDMSYHETGGFTLQYLAETKGRFPSASVFHNSLCCEVASRKFMYPYFKFRKSYWAGNKLSMSYGYDWLRLWLANNKDKSRFAVTVAEETHSNSFMHQIDMEVANLFGDLFLSRKGHAKYNTGNTAIIVMADHGKLTTIIKLIFHP